MSEKMLLVCGLGRSGTTLLAEQLGRIGVQIGPETQLFWRPWGQDVLADPARLREAMEAHPYLQWYAGDIDLVGGAPWTLDSLWKACMQIAKDRLDGVLLAEKTPEHVFGLPELMEAHPTLHAIVCVRDPRDVADSFQRVYFGPDDPLETARKWRRAAVIAQQMQETYPDRVQIHRHEDFLQDPEGFLHRYAGWLGIPSHLREVDKASSFDPVGSPFKVAAAKAPDAAAAFKWRKLGPIEARLAAGRHQQVTVLCRPHITKFGYEDPWGPAARWRVWVLLVAAAIGRRRSWVLKKLYLTGADPRSRHPALRDRR